MAEWMEFSDYTARFEAGAEKAREAKNPDAFRDLVVAARACACIGKQIERAEKWLEKLDA